MERKINDHKILSATAISYQLADSQRDVTLTFLQIERIIGDRLPPSASNHRPCGPMKKMDNTAMHMPG